MNTKNSAEAATVPSTARGIDLCGSLALLAERGRRLEPDEQQDAEQHAVETPPTVTPKSDVSPGLNTDSVLPSAPLGTMIAKARISIGMNESAANVSIAPIAIRTPR